jgi:hypothetical protein
MNPGWKGQDHIWSLPGYLFWSSYREMINDPKHYISAHCHGATSSQQPLAKILIHLLAVRLCSYWCHLDILTPSQKE